MFVQEAANCGLRVQILVKNVYLYHVIDESLKNLIIATPVIGVLVFFLKYFMTEAKEERKKREDNAIKDTKVLEGLAGHIDTSNRKHDDTNRKIDSIIKKLDK